MSFIFSTISFFMMIIHVSHWSMFSRTAPKCSLWQILQEVFAQILQDCTKVHQSAVFAHVCLANFTRGLYTIFFHI